MNHKEYKLHTFYHSSPFLKYLIKLMCSLKLFVHFYCTYSQPNTCFGAQDFCADFMYIWCADFKYNINFRLSALIFEILTSSGLCYPISY